MILQGNQRGGARDLALHLMKDENDHVTVHELRGFVSDDLLGALKEADAISRGTKAKQFLYSLSLNPPPDENVSTQDFVAAVDRAEERLGLSGQPRGIVFHEKQGADGHVRRHAHAVWSRIDMAEMKAIPLPYTKYKLQELSRELYIEHGWNMPRGFLSSEERDPRNYTLAQWQQAKRRGKDPKAIKAAMQECWSLSDSQSAFQNALKLRGFTLARGNRRSFVALDEFCEPYAVPKWVGIKTKDVRVRLSEPEKLPTIEDARNQIAREMTERLEEIKATQNEAVSKRQHQISQKRDALIKQQTEERERLKAEQATRQVQEIKRRQARFKKGVRGLWDRLTGRHKKLLRQNETETRQAEARDQQERDALVFKQQDQSRHLQDRIRRLEQFRQEREQTLTRDIEQYRGVNNGLRENFQSRNRHNRHKIDPGPEREI